MKQAMQRHLALYGRVLGFLTTHARLSEGIKEPGIPLDIDRYCSSCRRFQSTQDDTALCALQCEHYQLFHAGWQEGVAQAQQVFEHMDLDLIEEIGRTAGLTSKHPPRHYRWVYAERDGADAKLHGEALKRFISGWRQTGGDRRPIKGV